MITIEQIRELLQESFVENHIKARVVDMGENSCYYRFKLLLQPGTKVHSIRILLPNLFKQYGIPFRCVTDQGNIFVVVPKFKAAVSVLELMHKRKGAYQLPVGIGPDDATVFVGPSLLICGEEGTGKSSLLQMMTKEAHIYGDKVVSLCPDNYEPQTIRQKISDLYEDANERFQGKNYDGLTRLFIDDLDICGLTREAYHNLLVLANVGPKVGICLAVSISNYDPELGPLLTHAFYETLSFRQDDAYFFCDKVDCLLIGEAMLFDKDGCYRYVKCAR